MSQLSNLYGYIMTSLTPEEFQLVMQDPSNISIVLADRTLKEVVKQAKNGKRTIYRIGHKGQVIIGKAHRIRIPSAFRFSLYKKEQKSGGN